MQAHRLPSELFLAGAVAVVGAVDAAVGADHDLLVLFVAIAVLCLVAIARAVRTGTGVRLRPDIDRWLAQTAAEQGERPADLADRAIGAFRADLVHDPTDLGTSERTP
jgi:hypothetical protein